MHTRFKGDTTGQFDALKRAADDYPRSLTDSERLGLWHKPLDWNAGHPTFFNQMYQILNGIRAMGLPPAATVVEVGSGSGWSTEILAGLGYKVICLEPAEVMLDAARQRVPEFLALRRMQHLAQNVSYHCTTLEEASFIPDRSADAMVFFESFHHIIDEHKAVGEAWRILKPGAVLCILGDSNWIPGHTGQESFWLEEMERFGTLESPFTHVYLEQVLKTHGFADIRRHHAVNGLVPVDQAHLPAAELAGDLHAAYVNLFTARRPGAEAAAEEPAGLAPAAVHPSPPRLWTTGLKLARTFPFLRPVLKRVWVAAQARKASSQGRPSSRR